MRYALVLGKKLGHGCAISQEYQAQLDKAAILFKQGTVDKIILSGGMTSDECPSEAAVGLKMLPLGCRSSVILEDRSKSTSENIRNVCALLSGRTIDKLIVVTCYAHEPRTYFLLKRLWPGVLEKVEFDGVATSAASWIVNQIFYILTLLDPNDKIFLPIQKMIYKNG